MEHTQPANTSNNIRDKRVPSKAVCQWSVEEPSRAGACQAGCWTCCCCHCCSSSAAAMLNCTLLTSLLLLHHVLSTIYLSACLCMLHLVCLSSSRDLVAPDLLQQRCCLLVVHKVLPHRFQDLVQCLGQGRLQITCGEETPATRDAMTSKGISNSSSNTQVTRGSKLHS